MMKNMCQKGLTTIFNLGPRHEPMGFRTLQIKPAPKVFVPFDLLSFVEKFWRRKIQLAAF
jgi:hypothetical protein